MNQHPKVLLAFKNLHATDPGVCHQGLGITATNVSMVLSEAGIDNALWPVVDGYDLRKRLRWHQADGYTHVVLFAPFFDIGFMEQLAAEWPGIQWAVTCHSNVGFLQSDRWSLKVMRQGVELAKKYPNFHVAGNSAKFARFIREAYAEDCLWLPNLYHLDPYVKPTEPRPSYSGHGTLRIGIFGATRALKNISSAAGAAVIIAEQLGSRVELWVSKGREEGPGADRLLDVVTEITKGLGHFTVRPLNWQLWPDFKASVRKMHLTLQPSFTETFNNVSCDSASQGVPVVCSPAITWAPRHWTADPDDVCDIARTGMSLMRDPRARLEGWDAIHRHNREALLIWRDWLTQ